MELPQVPVDADPIQLTSGAGYPALLQQNRPSKSDISTKILNLYHLLMELIKRPLFPGGTPQNGSAEVFRKSSIVNLQGKSSWLEMSFLDLREEEAVHL